MRELQTSDSGEILARDGSNATGVFRLLAEVRPEQRARIEECLSRVVPGVRGVEARVPGPRETLEFRQEVAGAKNPWHFLAANMSDGTLHALGILLGLFQDGNGKRITLVGMEEPEIALHPAAAGILLDALREASRDSQIVVTSHSPDLMDIVDLKTESILAVHKEAGNTVIGPIDLASVTVLRQGLYTPGDLLRLGQDGPDVRLFGRSPDQKELFERVPAHEVVDRLYCGRARRNQCSPGSAETNRREYRQRYRPGHSESHTHAAIEAGDPRRIGKGRSTGGWEGCAARTNPDSDGCGRRLSRHACPCPPGTRPSQPLRSAYSRRYCQQGVRIGFLAAAESLRARFRSPVESPAPAEAEEIRGAKEWLRERLSGGRYSPTVDQPALAAIFDLRQARAAPSFDKLWREMERLSAGPGLPR
jgi:hypothetical protein